MNPNRELSNFVSKLTEIAYIAIVLLASYYFIGLWLNRNYEWDSANWYLLMEGKAATPFQYRVLVPWIVKWLSQIRIFGKEIAPVGPTEFWIEYASIVCMVMVFRKYLSLFFDKASSRIISLAVFIILPFNLVIPQSIPIRYPSDIPSILFITVGLILLYKRSWVLFYPLFIISTLNRETSCFLTVIYLCIAYREEKPGKILTHIAAQMLIWVAIKYMLYRMFISNRFLGIGICQNTIRANIDLLRTPAGFGFFLSNLGYLWIPTLVYWKYISDIFVRKSVLCLIPFFVSMFFVGDMSELRIYAELMPVVLPAFFLILKELFRREG